MMARTRATATYAVDAGLFPWDEFLLYVALGAVTAVPALFFTTLVVSRRGPQNCVTMLVNTTDLAPIESVLAVVFGTTSIVCGRRVADALHQWRNSNAQRIAPR